MCFVGLPPVKAPTGRDLVPPLVVAGGIPPRSLNRNRVFMEVWLKTMESCAISTVESKAVG